MEFLNKIFNIPKKSTTFAYDKEAWRNVLNQMDKDIYHNVKKRMVHILGKPMEDITDYDMVISLEKEVQRYRNKIHAYESKIEALIAKERE